MYLAPAIIMGNLVKFLLPLILLTYGASQWEPEEENVMDYTQATINCISTDQFANLCSGDYQYMLNRSYKSGDK